MQGIKSMELKEQEIRGGRSRALHLIITLNYRDFTLILSLVYGI